MKMSDVQPGMRLKSTLRGADDEIITVTKLTERGFKYDLSETANLSLHPRLGLTMIREGHEHFGLNGEAFFEPVSMTAPHDSPPPARGFFATLTPEQQARALAYTGPENFGDPAFAIKSAPEQS